MIGTKELAKQLPNKAYNSRKQAWKIKDQGKKERTQLSPFLGRLLAL